ncbi:MAG: hypothetical protein IBJ19_16285 [Gemmatimonadaceae bacterium]|nr:hypothetical protein [Gemmatimonadaceae bacterium]
MAGDGAGDDACNDATDCADTPAMALNACTRPIVSSSTRIPCVFLDFISSSITWV